MDLEITSTPRETHVWAPGPQQAATLRRELSDAGFLVYDAHPWGLEDAGLIPEGQGTEFDPERIFDVVTGADANASLQALVDSGHRLVWHRWQTRLSRKVWGVTVAIPPRGKTRAVGTDSAVHFGVTVRSLRGLGLRMTRENYARINKRSSEPRWSRDMDPELWDSVDEFFEDADHRTYTDAWCQELQTRALMNYDLNMAHFAALDRAEFETALQAVIASQSGMVEVTDLNEWDGVPGLYVMVLDAYAQVYVGATSDRVGIAKRIRQHWTNQKQLDRLVYESPRTSILSIDSFRALDTTRIFALKTSRSFDGENPLLEQFPAKFTLNRVMGGRDVARFAGLIGVDKIMRRRDFSAY
ncbi:hypothetical protein AB0O70_13035 [Microbacterium paraoxydans]|jgi:hypothetical protein|uniref:hypothetical protein n=1 Tax=Microbacterium paraoxydans TaxID=199592 RepID=UPI0034374286